MDDDEEEDHSDFGVGPVGSTYDRGGWSADTIEPSASASAPAAASPAAQNDSPLADLADIARGNYDNPTYQSVRSNSQRDSWAQDAHDRPQEVADAQILGQTISRADNPQQAEAMARGYDRATNYEPNTIDWSNAPLLSGMAREVTQTGRALEDNPAGAPIRAVGDAAEALITPERDPTRAVGQFFSEQGARLQGASRAANPGMAFAGEVAGALGRGVEWTDRNLGQPILGHIVGGVTRAEQALGIPDPHVQDPMYQQLLSRDPAAAQRYANEAHSVPVVTGLANMAANPANYLGTGAAGGALRSVESAAARGGANTVARGLGRAASVADFVDKAVNMPGELAQRGAMSAIGHVPGLGQSAQSADVLASAAQRDAVQGAERAGVSLEDYLAANRPRTTLEDTAPQQAGRQMAADLGTPQTPGRFISEANRPAEEARQAGRSRIQAEREREAQKTVDVAAERFGVNSPQFEAAYSRFAQVSGQTPEYTAEVLSGLRGGEAPAARNGTAPAPEATQVGAPPAGTGGTPQPTTNGAVAGQQFPDAREAGFFMDRASAAVRESNPAMTPDQVAREVQSLYDTYGTAAKQIQVASRDQAAREAAMFDVGTPERSAAWNEHDVRAGAAWQEALDRMGQHYTQGPRDGMYDPQGNVILDAAKMVGTPEPATTQAAGQFPPNVVDRVRAALEQNGGDIDAARQAVGGWARGFEAQGGNFEDVVAAASRQADTPPVPVNGVATAVPEAAPAPPSVAPVTNGVADAAAVGVRTVPASELTTVEPQKALPPGNRFEIVGEGRFTGPGSQSELAAMGVRGLGTPEAKQAAATAVENIVRDTASYAQRAERLTPDMKAALERAAGHIDTTKTLEAASIARSRAEMLEQRAPHSTQLSAILDKYGASTAKEIVPERIAAAAYYEALGRELGGTVPPRSTGLWGAIDKFMGEWRSAVLTGGGRFVFDIADFTLKSGLEGFFPFSGRVGEIFDKYGYASLPTLVKATQGGVGLANDMLFSTKRFSEKLGFSGAREELGNLARNEWDQIKGGHVLGMTHGFVKELTDAIVGFYDGNARAGLAAQVLDRDMRAVVSRMVKDGTADFGRDIANSLYTLEKVTPSALYEHLIQQGVQDVVANRWAGYLAQNLERAEAHAYQTVGRVHANYADRSALEMTGAFGRAFAFTKWAMGNTRFYAEATLNRPAMWSLISAYDRAARESGELGDARPAGLQRQIEVGGPVGSFLAGLAYADPRMKLFTNAFNRGASIPGISNQSFTGPGATKVGQVASDLTALTGIGLAPYIQQPLDMGGWRGDVAINSPVSNRSAVGGMIQETYQNVVSPALKAMGAPTTQSLDFDYSRAARSVGLGQTPLNQRFADPNRAQTGAGPGWDAEIRERVFTLAPDRTTALEAANNPQHPLYQQALQAALADRSSTGQQMARSAGALRGMSPERYESRAEFEPYAQQRKALEAQGIKPAEADRVAREAHPAADNYFNMNSPRQYQQELAAYDRAGIRPPSQTGYAPPEFPTGQPTPDQYQEYNQQLTAAQLGRAEFMQGARGRFNDIEARDAAAGALPRNQAFEARQGLRTERLDAPTAFRPNQSSPEQAQQAARINALREQLSALPADQIQQAYYRDPAYAEVLEYDRSHYAGERQTYLEQGLGYKRADIEAAAGLQRPAYPGQGATPEQWDAYTRADAAYQVGLNRALEQARGRFNDLEHREFGLPAQAAQRFTDLQNQGLGPWSGSAWDQAKNQQTLDKQALNHDRFDSGVASAFAVPKSPFETAARDQASAHKERIDELRGNLNVNVPPEQRADVYSNHPHYAELREYDRSRQTEPQRTQEAAWRERQDGYFQAMERIKAIPDGAARAEAYQQMGAQFPEGGPLPGFAAFLEHNEPFQERLQRAVQTSYYDQFKGLNLDANRADRITYAQRRDATDKIVQKVAQSGSKNSQTGQAYPTATPQEIEYAANRLGIKLAPQTIAPTGINLARQGPEQTAEWAVNRAMAPDQVVGLPQRQTAIQQGAYAPLGQPRTASAATAAAPPLSQPRAASPSAARGAGATAFDRTVPFSGGTPKAQLATAYSYASAIKQQSGEAAMNKWIYEQYDKLSGLKAQLGETMAPRSTIGRMALDLSSRPGALQGQTLQQGQQRLGQMISALDHARRDPNFDRSRFTAAWSKAFGEKLSLQDLTQEGIQAKYDWALANYQQAKRYSETAGGQKEVLSVDKLRHGFETARDARDRIATGLRELNAQATVIHTQARGIANTRDRAGFYKQQQAQLDKITQAREALGRQYEQAKARAEQAAKSAFGERSTTREPNPFDFFRP